MASSPFQCRECGCDCISCPNSNSLHLHREIEQLKREVRDRDFHIVRMETSVMVSADKYPNGEYAALNEEMHLWQDRYERLLENHRKLQRVNQGLEDKLLKIVDKYETEKNALNRDIANLTSRLVEARISLAHFEEENEQYRNDCNIAIQLLQCKPSNFVAHKLDTFPVELQQKAKLHLSNNRKGTEGVNNQHNNIAPEIRTIRVPIPTFPPTAMVYSVSNGDLTSPSTTEGANGSWTTPNSASLSGNCNDVVSAAIMAKVLEEREKERRGGSGSAKVAGCNGRHCSSASVARRSSWLPEDDTVSIDVGCQTRWSVPIDGAPQTVQCVCGRLVLVPGALPGTRLPVATTAGVHHHVQKRLETATETNGKRQWTRSGSSTSTETEI